MKKHIENLKKNKKAPVNRRVVGSNPTWGAIKSLFSNENRLFCCVFLFPTLAERPFNVR